MDGLDCPSCGSDDVRGEPNPGGTITLTCQSCQTSWARVPKPSCPRCGKSDVEEYGAQDWVYDDPASRREHRSGAQRRERAGAGIGSGCQARAGTRERLRSVGYAEPAVLGGRRHRSGRSSRPSRTRLLRA